jgi:transposase
MTPPPDPSAPSAAEKDALIARLAARVAELAAAVAALEAENAALRARLDLPPKTPDNSSLPPSQGQKPNRVARRAAGRRKSLPRTRSGGRPGVFRALAERPDRVVAALAERCPHCAHELTAADQPDFHAYDHIDLPPIRPVVTRVHRHRGACPACRRRFGAPAPDGMAPGSPFGPGIAALALHLHATQAIGFERLALLFREAFGLTISEGALANLLARAEGKLAGAAAAIAARVRASPVVASDETSARVGGRAWWQWVLLSSTAVAHLIADSRGARVASAFLQGARPEVWVADRYAGQAGHGAARQVCLAHLLRDAQYAIDAGDRRFAPGFQRLLRRAVGIGRRRDDLKGTTLAQYRADLDRRLGRLLAAAPADGAAGKLARAVRRCRGDLFRFVTRRDVPYTNNACERALRPSVVFRKVTGGFRSEWGARLYAATASVIATGRMHGKSALQAIQDALAAKPLFSSA